MPRNTLGYSPESNGTAEAFVKTIRRDYVYLPDAETVLRLLPTWLEDHNEHQSHEGRKCSHRGSFAASNQLRNAAAHWARDNYGLTFKCLPANGKIIKGLKSAMNSAIRRGELLREGTKKVRRVVDEG